MRLSKDLSYLCDKAFECYTGDSAVRRDVRTLDRTGTIIRHTLRPTTRDTTH